jgi:hypothetical protein
LNLGFEIWEEGKLMEEQQDLKILEVLYSTSPSRTLATMMVIIIIITFYSYPTVFTR